jgi:hypothetical protein
VDSDGVVFMTSFFYVRLNKPSRKGFVIQLKSCKHMLKFYVGRCKKYTGTKTKSSWCRLDYTRCLELHWSMSNKSSKSSNFSHTKLFTKRLENWSIRSGSVGCQPINSRWYYQLQKIVALEYFFLQKHSFSSSSISRLFPHSIFSHSIYPRRH